VMPVTAVVFLIAMLAVSGMPPFSLFQSEFLIVKAVFDGGHYLVTALFLLFAAAIFAGFLLHIGGLVLGEPEEATPAKGNRWRDSAILVLAGLLAMFAFWMPAPLQELIGGAARVVTGP
jgi:hydrogenase-4 component F